MTSEQIDWLSAYPWFERAGEDDQGRFVVMWDCFGSRSAVLFHDFDEVIDWASYQRIL